MIDRVIDSRGLDSFDLRFMGLIAVILSVGVLSIYSVTHSQDTAFPFYLKQLVWILLGTVAFLVMYLSDYHKIARLSYRVRYRHLEAKCLLQHSNPHPLPQAA